MIKTFRFLSREVRGMHQAAYVLALFSLGSQVLALIRDRLLASAFGAGHTLDIYYAAFRVPDFLFATIASLLSLYALLPILSRLEKEGEDIMVSFVRSILVVLFLAMAVVGMIAYILAPVLADLTAPGIARDPAYHADFILLMRILLLQPILLGASNTIAALTQLRHRFILYSVSPLLYNVGIIFGALVLYPHVGIAGLGWGVVFGALMHVGVQTPFFFAEKSAGMLSFDRIARGLREVLHLSVPRTVALASTQISLLVLTALASFLAPGSIAVFVFAFNIQSVPLAIIGVSYSVAAFPTLAHLYAQGKHGEFRSYIEAALRHIIFWSVPAMVFMIVLRAQIVRVILGTGAFDWNATRLTAAALALFIVALAAQSITLLIARTYYAIGNSKKPLLYGCADIVVSISSATALAYAFHSSATFHAFVESLLRVEGVPGTTILMLALGYALGSIVEFVIGYIYFMRDFTIKLRQIGRLTFQSLSASIIGGAVAYQVLAYSGYIVESRTTIGVFAQGVSAGLIGIAVTIFILVLLKNNELAETVSTFKNRITKKPPALEQGSVA
jgi:putative peptidoglycan lipid II flippase